MTSAPHHRTTWARVLTHRDPADGCVAELARWTTPDVVAEVLADRGRGLTAQLDALPTERDWVGECGGLSGAVLVLAEVDAAHR
ncbi:hypothetical protein MN205_01560 [Kineococcus sp. TRM81007]|uniref:hypothetical protein n=1 Tax=Kineococcus sp. TRM81007 TaxID=2925831 RepID=UPI001F56AD20|nr:hypothetical protein [Kineococcus sp. TRM81007]MCI2237181.1 hypothetical protein [Kineococcus sp. TRM81007]